MSVLSRVRGFKFNNAIVDNYNSESVYLLDVSRPAVAEQTFTSYEIPNRDGVKTVADKYSYKQITLTIGIYALKASERRIIERNLLKDIVGKKGKLIFLDEPSLYYEAQTFDSIDRAEKDVWTEISIRFICSPTLKELFNDLRDELISDSQKYADDEGMLVNLSSWQNVKTGFSDKLVNTGNYKCLPEIYFFGTAELITLRINNSEFAFKDLTSFVYINCENLVVYTIIENTKKSLLTQFSGVFPEIPVGESIIEIGGNSLNLDEIQINFPNTYIV